MSFPVRARIAVAAVLAVAAGAAAASRVAEIEPYLEISVVREGRNENYDLWDVVVKARGGETIDEVTLETLSGPVLMVDKFPRIVDLHSGWTKPFRVQLNDGLTQNGEILVVQKGRVSRTYKVRIGDAP